MRLRLHPSASVWRVSPLHPAWRWTRDVYKRQTQGSGKEWSKQDRDTFDPTHDIDRYCDLASGCLLYTSIPGKCGCYRFWLRSIVQNGQVHPGTGEASHVPVMVVPGNVLCLSLIHISTATDGSDACARGYVCRMVQQGSGEC